MAKIKESAPTTVGADSFFFPFEAPFGRTPNHPEEIDMNQAAADARPLIGVTAGLDENGYLHVRNGYMLSVARAGGIPVILPLDGTEEMLADALGRIDGLLISGGADVEPALYGAEREPECGPADPARDRLEFLAARYAREHDLPVLGICRGCQVLNAAAGGTLVQDIEKTFGTPKAVHTQPEDYAVATHWVDLVEGGLVAEITGAPEVKVNSRHHQCVKDLAPGFVLDGRSRIEGLVEAFHDPRLKFHVGVQWHPEMLTAEHPEALALFRALVRASRN